MESMANRDNSSQRGDFYTAVAPFYDALVGPFLMPARKGVVRGAEAQKCRRILEVACGTGEQAIMLAKAGIEVTGIDLSPAMLGVARGKSPPSVAYFLANAEDLPFGSGSFDCATISLALHEMAHETRMRTMGEMLRVLTADGKLIVFDYAAPENWRIRIRPDAFGSSGKNCRWRALQKFRPVYPNGRDRSISQIVSTAHNREQKLFSWRPAARYFGKEAVRNH